MDKKNIASRRLSSLDGLRGTAVLAVLLYHYTYWYEHVVSQHPSILFRFPWGKFGVECFFVISGFVISLTLDRTKTLVEFVRARLARLYPTFLTCLLITSTITALAGPPDMAWQWCSLHIISP